jgi:hypothetical protein
MKTIPVKLWTHDEWTAALSRLDYLPDPTIHGWRHNGVAFHTNGAWSLVEQIPHVASADRLRGVIGQAGLWKVVNDGAQVRRVFELPTPLLLDTYEEDAAGDEPCELLDDCLAWAGATLEGRAPEGWRPPPREQIEEWLSKGALTVQRGSVVRQGEWLHTPDALALRVPVLPVLPADLPEPNTRFLEQILLEATNQWRLVRLGIVEEDGVRAVIAEVNFTGAGPAVIERLLSASLASLHWAALGVAESAELLADVTLTPRALALGGVGPSINQKENI